MYDWVRIGEVARMFGISNTCVRNWCKEGLIPPCIVAKGQRRWHRDVIVKAALAFKRDGLVINKENAK